MYSVGFNVYFDSSFYQKKILHFSFPRNILSREYTTVPFFMYKVLCAK